MKKSLSLLVAIAMVFSMFATVVSAAEKTAGEKLQDFGIIKGTSEGLAEDAEWLRQDITVLIARLLGKEEAAKATANTHGFTDLDSKFYNGFVSWAKTEGYFTGETATEFGVNNPITNQQFAAVLLRVLGVKDVPYAESLTKAVELKLVSADLVAADNAIRGDIYTTLVTALDYEIDGKKLGTILNLPGYEITDVKVVGASATNSKTVKVEFNQEIGAVLANNFVVKNKETDSVEVISTVSVSDKTATLTLFDSLSKDKTYVVEVSDVTSKDGKATQVKAETAEFTYVKTAAASIEIPQTTVAYGKEVAYVIKDAAGNDITVDFDLNGLIEVSTSNGNVVDDTNNYTLTAQDLSTDAKTTNYAVVNVVLTIDDETTLETGNVVITVQPSVGVISGISEITLGTPGEDAVTSLFKNDDDEILSVVVLDAAGDDITADAGTEISFKSSNPTVLVVDQISGSVTPVKAGSATVVATAKFNGKTVTKSVVITVKENAKLAGIEVDKSSVKIVEGSDLEISVKVTLKDQYGDALKDAALQDYTIASSKADVVDGYDVAKAEVAFTADKGEDTIAIAQHASLNGKDSAVLTVKAGNFKKTISVSFVDGAALAGYAVELSDTKIDVNGGTTDPNALKNNSATVTVYAKDKNGNYLYKVNSNDVELTEENASGGAVEVDENNHLQLNAKNKGSEKVTVSVNNVKVGTYTITVVNTGSELTKVVQTKNAITLKSGISSAEGLIVGTSTDDGAFVGYNQYGKKIQITDYVLVSSNSKVLEISNNGKDATRGSETGTVLVTIVVNDNAYTVTVKVE